MMRALWVGLAVTSLMACGDSDSSGPAPTSAADVTTNTDTSVLEDVVDGTDTDSESTDTGGSSSTVDGASLDVLDVADEPEHRGNQL